MNRPFFLCASIFTTLATASCSPAASTDGGDATADAVNDIAIGIDTPDVSSANDDAGGPVNGPVDMHCTVDGGSIARVVDPAACMPDGGDASALDAGGPVDLGVPIFNGVGDDDACKYHIELTGTTLARFANVTFILTLSNRSDGSPVVGAAPHVELILDPRQPPIQMAQVPQEAAAGVYSVGPVRFNASGDWTVRFHLFDRCVDGPDSPRAHAAFLIHVP